MKKIPQPGSDTPANDEPVDASLALMPGTETPRSLGDIIREAETASKHSESGAQATEASESAAGAKSQVRRSKRPSRAQARRFARERALQALYQWDVSDASVTAIRQEFLDNQDMSRVDVDYFQLLYDGVAKNPQPIDDTLQEHLDRPIADLDPIERAVLRIAAYELSAQAQLPVRVAINEGIEITKRFGADNGHRYVNGVLDKLALALRPLEMQRRSVKK